MKLDMPAGFRALRLRPNRCIDACGPLHGRRGGDALRLGRRV